MGSDSLSSAPPGSWDLPEPLARAIETEVIPRMLLSHRVGPLPPLALARAAVVLGEPEVAEFVRALRGPGEGSTSAFVEGLMAGGVTAEAVYLDLLAPAARSLGRLWEEDTCDFVEVTVALGRMQRVLRDLSRVFLSEVDDGNVAGRILLASVPGEQHTLGLFMVAEFFVRGGWLVSVGPPLMDQELRAAVGEQWFDVVGFSVACESRVSRLCHEIRRIRRASRNGSLVVLVGGRAFDQNPELAQRVGADGTSGDPRDAPALAATLVARHGGEDKV